MLPLLLLGLLVSAFAPGVARAQASSSLEYRVKAVFLLNFAKFIEWPAEAFKDDASPITIGVLGDDPFGPLLEDTVKGESIKGRRLVIKRVSRVDETDGCHVIFVSASEKNLMQEIIHKLDGSHVLTVGETANFLDLGGVIRFTMIEGKVHFEIDEAAAARGQLKVSSKLLKLATTVKPKQEDGTR